MTNLLQQAFDKASELSQAEQNVLATFLLEELASERKWETLFAKSDDFLGTLADEALKEHHRGETLPLNAEKP